jgi:uncharacterized membrane protein
MSASKSQKQERNLILCVGTYFFTWLSGIVVYLFINKKEDAYLKFHALQAILLGIAIFVVFWIPIPFFPILSLILWIYGLYVGYEASQGNDIEMPIIGEFVKKHM